LTGKQRPMMHFDFQVGDLESAAAERCPRRLGRGPTSRSRTFRVLFDPAGHPSGSAERRLDRGEPREFDWLLDSDPGIRWQVLRD